MTSKLFLKPKSVYFSKSFPPSIQVFLIYLINHLNKQTPQKMTYLQENVYFYIFFVNPTEKERNAAKTKYFNRKSAQKGSPEK